jgi:hypothetical protein
MAPAAKPPTVATSRPPRRRALLIGINYTGLPTALAGCVNDVAEMRKLCSDLKYNEVCVLYDGAWPGKFDPKDARLVKGGRPDVRPSRANMLAAMKWLVSEPAPGDVLLFHYSGHGGQAGNATDRAEPDGLDETVLPVDYSYAGQITDDELKRQLVEPLRGSGATLRAVLDSCHSGTGLDLLYNISDKTEVRVGPELKGKRAFNATGAERLAEWKNDKALSVSPVDACLISGCADPQSSAEAIFNRRPAGALTHFLLDYLRMYWQRGARWPTAAEIAKNVRWGLLAAGFSQVPQLSSEESALATKRFNLL